MPKFRAMNITDIPSVYQLGAAVFTKAETSYGDWSISRVATLFETSGNHCFVAEEGDELVGFSLGNNLCRYDPDAGFVEWTCVSPALAASGLGVKLFSRVVTSFQKIGKSRIITDTVSGKDSVTAMLKRFGFKKTEQIECWEFNFSSPSKYLDVAN